MNGAGGDIRSICVAGAGIVGLSAALLFSRALPKTHVTLIETAPDPAALADRMPGSLPPIHRFHAAIGLNELDLVRGGAATHLLGSRFEKWSRGGDPWLHVFDEYGLRARDAEFHGLWQRARRAGRALPYHRYAAAAALAEAGKFVHPSQDPRSPLGNFLYALRLDPDAYRDRLAAAAAKLPRTAGAIVGIERRDDGGVAAIRLDGDRRVEADLFVDCTGPSARLRAALDSAFEDWGAWLPCDRLLISEEAAREPNPCDRVVAEKSGWRSVAPLPGRSLIIRVYRAGDLETPGAARLRPGRRPEPWRCNVLAVGDAAVAVDPLHGTNLHLAQSALLRALELMPGRDCHPLELAEYNRRTIQETDRVRDFLAVHYLRSGRSEGIWKALARAEPPRTLARTLAQFERRGRLPFFEEESFDKQSWLAVLAGLGVMSDHVHPIALGVDAAKAEEGLKALAERLSKIHEKLPLYRDLLTRMKR